MFQSTLVIADERSAAAAGYLLLKMVFQSTLVMSFTPVDHLSFQSTLVIADERSALTSAGVRVIRWFQSTLVIADERSRVHEPTSPQHPSFNPRSSSLTSEAAR